MGQEIEKKYLLLNDDWRKLGKGKSYCQGYLSSEKGRTVRIRTINTLGIITIKGLSKNGIRPEYEYEIPFEDAKEMLSNLCLQPLIRKTRYKIPWENFIWEVDEFEGDNMGLIFAEIELEYPGQKFPKPPWIGQDVTDDRRYYNANLVAHPYKMWKTNK